jgi:hypothetical protein
MIVGERSIVVAQATNGQGKEETVRSAEWLLPQGLTLESPAELGAALRVFLDQHAFTATLLVIGAPAKWLLAREKQMPPSTPQLAASMIRLQAERELSLEAKDILVDYAGDVDAAAPRQVLLVALLRAHLDRVIAASAAAGLKLTGVVPLALLAAEALGADGPRFGLVIRPEAAELVAVEGGRPRLLRHLATRPPDAAAANGAGWTALGAEIRRVAAALSSTTDVSTIEGSGVEGSLYGREADLGEPELQALTDASGIQWRIAAGPGRGSRVELAAELSRRGHGRGKLPLDLLHSRCAVASRRRFDRRMALGAAAVLALIVGAVAFVLDVGSRERELEALRERIATGAPDVAAAEASSAMISKGLGWYERRPPFLGILKHLTLAFPEEGVVWATTFSARDNRKGLVSGRAIDQKSVLTLLDHLETSADFSEVKLTEMREATGTRSEVAFSLSFTYTGMDPQ